MKAELRLVAMDKWSIVSFIIVMISAITWIVFVILLTAIRVKPHVADFYLLYFFRLWCYVQNGRLFCDNPRFIYRKGRTIGNSLVRSDIEPKNKPLQVISQKEGTYACLSCQNCSAVIKDPSINRPHLIQLKGQYTCNSSAVIYILNIMWARPVGL